MDGNTHRAPNTLGYTAVQSLRPYSNRREWHETCDNLAKALDLLPGGQIHRGLALVENFKRVGSGSVPDLQRLLEQVRGIPCPPSAIDQVLDNIVALYTSFADDWAYQVRQAASLDHLGHNRAVSEQVHAHLLALHSQLVERKQNAHSLFTADELPVFHVQGGVLHELSWAHYLPPPQHDHAHLAHSPHLSHPSFSVPQIRIGSPSEEPSVDPAFLDLSHNAHAQDTSGLLRPDAARRSRTPFTPGRR